VRVTTKFATAAVALALVAAACSSSKKSSSASSASSSSAAGATGASGTAPNTSCTGPGISNGKLTVGVIQQSTGNPLVVLDFQHAIQTVKARFALQNAQGGVDGLQLEAVSADDGGTTTQNLSAARQLVEQNGVFGIVEMSIEPGGSGDYLKSKGIPVTGWATASDPYALDNNFFGATGGIDADPAKTPDTSIVGFLQSKGVTNLALFGGTDPGSIAVSQGTAAAAKAIGMTVGYSTNSIAFGDKDFTGDVAKMQAAHVNGVVTELDPTTNLALAAAIKQAGMSPVILFTTGYDQRLVSAVGPAIAGIYFLVPFAPFELNRPSYQTFKSAMDQYAPSVPIAEVSAITWISADLFIRGLQAAGGCPTRQAFISNLRKVTYDAGGFINPVDEGAAVGKSIPCEWEVQAEGKAFVPVSSQPYCGKFVS
jgi:ABC-type branched-subunit amino acid transport system substrate-binding protein